MIKQESVREVIDMARVEDIVGDYVNLRRRGQNLIGLCPFHGEKTPSFNVNPARNIYKCFGCGQSGDAVKFLMEYEQLSFPDAIRKIAARYNFKLEEIEVSDEVREERREKEALLLVNDFARQFYEQQLYETDEGKSVGLAYFKGRGYRRDVMKRFGLGFAPSGRNALFQAATAAGYKEEQLEQLGLIRNKRDFFYDRVMFTIHNLQGKPIAFAGRILKKNAKAPKYVNSPESRIYHKSDVLYGIYQARQAIRRQDNVYMVEGYTDVISLHQNGVENVVATSGTSLTPGQAKLVNRQTENVTLLYDGDKAGIKAALRGVDVLLVAGLNVRVVMLPAGEDPDSYVQKTGASAFTEYLEKNRRDFLFFKSDLLLEEAGDDVAARSAAIRSSIGTLALVDDPLKRQGYLQKFSQRLGLDESLLVNLINTAVADRRADAKRKADREQRQRQQPPRRPSGQRDAPPFPSRPSPHTAPASAPDSSPEPPSNTDDAWAGMDNLIEQAEGGQDWNDGEQAPFPGELQSAPLTPRSNAGKQLNSRLLYTGHTYQEQDLARLLIRHGNRPYDEQSDVSIAEFLTANVSDLLDEFDDDLSRRIINISLAYRAQHGQDPAPEYFLSHQDEKVKRLAAEATQQKYKLSPLWSKNYQVYLRQKPPEDNERMYADNFLRVFRIEKVVRKCQRNIEKIQKYEAEGNERKLVLHLKLQVKLDDLRKELGTDLGSVIL